MGRRFDSCQARHLKQLYSRYYDKCGWGQLPAAFVSVCQVLAECCHGPTPRNGDLSIRLDFRANHRDEITNTSYHRGDSINGTTHIVEWPIAILHRIWVKLHYVEEQVNILRVSFEKRKEHRQVVGPWVLDV